MDPAQMGWKGLMGLGLGPIPDLGITRRVLGV